MARDKLVSFAIGEKKFISMIVIACCALAVVAALSYFAFFHVKQCNDLECYKSAFSSCSRAVYTYDNAAEATWRYQIVRPNSGLCEVEVTLLQAKKGDVSLDKLKGLSMRCSVPNEVFDFPEKDLRKCTGRLREELQTTLIDKIYKYILPNMAKIGGQLNNLSLG